MKKKPGITPYLKEQETEGKFIKQSPGRKHALLPAQINYSVQNIRDLTDPRSVVIINEELRRLRIPIGEKDKEEKIISGGGGGAGGGGGIPTQPNLPETTPTTTEGGDTTKTDSQKIGIWSLTNFDDMVLVGRPRVVQGLNFEKGEFRPTKEILKQTIDFILRPDTLDPQYSTINNAQLTHIQAKSLIQLSKLRWLLYNFQKSVQVTDKLFVYDDDVDNVSQNSHNAEVDVVTLVNDEWFPGYYKYYGTNVDGRKGWYPLGGIFGVIEKEFAFREVNQRKGIKYRLKIGELPGLSILERIMLIVTEDPQIDVVISVGDEDLYANVAEEQSYSRYENIYYVFKPFENIYVNSINLYIYFDKICNLGRGKILGFYRIKGG